MMSDIDCKYGVQLVGPFIEEWRVTADGFRVPNMTARPNEDGTVTLCLDERFAIDATPEEAGKWICFVANAMAIGAGYSCFGANSVKRPNPFKVGMIGLAPPPPNLTVVK
jgi:hypothetical protein